MKFSRISNGMSHLILFHVTFCLRSSSIRSANSVTLWAKLYTDIFVWHNVSFMFTSSSQVFLVFNNTKVQSQHYTISSNFVQFITMYHWLFLSRKFMSSVQSSWSPTQRKAIGCLDSRQPHSLLLLMNVIVDIFVDFFYRYCAWLIHSKALKTLFRGIRGLWSLTPSSL